LVIVPMSALRRNNVSVRGHGARTIVFAHGYGCDQRMWRHVAPAFADDHRVVLFDHVGACTTDGSAYAAARYGTLHGYAADLLEIVRALGLPKVVFVGHSVSATVGLLAAASHPEYFERVVMVAPSPCFLNDGDYRGGFERDALDGVLASMDADYPAWATAMAPVIMGNPDRPALADELRDSFLRTDPAIARHFGRVTFLADHREDVARCTVPTLVMQGRDDAIAPREVGRWLHARLPQGTLAELAASGHCPHVSAPAETIDAIRAFAG
jgi:sigma-B regulation protein RsbQ